MPARAALMSGKPELIEEFVVPFCNCRDASIVGCWAVNDPDHGSDNLGLEKTFFTKVRSTTRGPGGRRSLDNRGAESRMGFRGRRCDPCFYLGGD